MSPVQQHCLLFFAENAPIPPFCSEGMVQLRPNPLCGFLWQEIRRGGRDNVVSVPLHEPCWALQAAGNTQITPWWKLWKHEVPAVNRSQKTLLGLAIDKPQNAPCCVPWRGFWLFSSRVFLPVRTQPAAISPRF